MKYIELLKFFNDKEIIKPEDVEFLGNPTTLRSQLSRWAASGKLIELKKGYYIFPDSIKKHPSLFYIANAIYFPSYISLQSALSFYDLIPEAVYSVTSVSTRKTFEIKNKLGNFIYKKIKKELFFAYKKIILDNHPVFIAEPEKALIDLIYLQHEDVSSFRILNHENLNKKRLFNILQKFPDWVKKRVEVVL